MCSVNIITRVFKFYLHVVPATRRRPAGRSEPVSLPSEPTSCSMRLSSFARFPDPLVLADCLESRSAPIVYLGLFTTSGKHQLIGRAWRHWSPFARRTPLTRSEWLPLEPPSISVDLLHNVIDVLRCIQLRVTDKSANDRAPYILECCSTVSC